MDEPAEYINIPHWMWILHVGSEQPCAHPGCTQHVYGQHKRDGVIVAGYCRNHFPAGVPVIDRNITLCVECGERANWLDYDGKDRCDVHHLTPADAGGHEPSAASHP